MIWNKHSNLRGLHAPFGASKHSWLRYDDEKIMSYYQNLKAIEIGTKLHSWAQHTIELGIKQPRSKKTIYAYVNDAIGFRMDPEVLLFYSPRFFGTADAISYRKGLLRIHDLKTGKRPASMEQLIIYAALFCLEYHVKPAEIKMELRIYQNDDVEICEPKAEDISQIMNKIIHLDKLLEQFEEGEY